MSIILIFLLAKFITLLVILLIASYYDIANQRIIPDKVWISGFGIGVSIVFSEFLFIGEKAIILLSLSSIFLMFLFCYLLNSAKKFGGADIKAILLLSVMFPLTYVRGILFPFPIIVLFFAGLLCMLGFLPVKSSEKKENVPLIPFIWVSFIACFVWFYF